MPIALAVQIWILSDTSCKIISRFYQSAPYIPTVIIPPAFQK
jgi:hypothetical protein